MPIVHIKVSNFEGEVLQSQKPVVVDFFADWCGPCKAFAPILEEFSEEEKGVKVCKLNVDKAQDIAARYKIESIPTIVFFRNGEEIDRFTGLKSKEALKEMVKKEE
ncbi:MAG: hypothetical protein ACD_63C00125G0013 [uncultured bacterium]|nr:MAG: hypothetical protein ACD_63C00125G0013 [uncultured bacterium]